MEHEKNIIFLVVIALGCGTATGDLTTNINVYYDKDARVFVVDTGGTEPRLKFDYVELRGKATLDDDVSAALFAPFRSYWGEEWCSNTIYRIREWLVGREGVKAIAEERVVSGSAEAGGHCVPFEEVVACSAKDTNEQRKAYMVWRLTPETFAKKEKTGVWRWADPKDKWQKVDWVMELPVVGEGGVSFVRIVKIGRLGCAPRHTLRFYCRGGKWIWQDINNTWGGCRVAVVDMDGDKNDEVVVERSYFSVLDYLVYGQNGKIASKDWTVLSTTNKVGTKYCPYHSPGPDSAGDGVVDSKK